MAARRDEPTDPPTARQVFASALRAWRSHRGVTRPALAGLLHVSEQMIGKLQSGERWPSKDLAERCDTILETGGELTRIWPLVEAERLASDRRRRRQATSSTPTPAPMPADGRRPGTESALRGALHHAATSGALTPAGVIATADEVRQLVEEMLDDSSTESSRLARLEADADQHARDALTTAPLEMVCRLSLDIIDARQLGRTRRSDDDQRRLRSVLARLAVLTADEMTVLGDVLAARTWYATASAAADASNERALRADVRALAAMLPLYHGSPMAAVRLAQDARALATDTACLATALAPMLEGLAWAKAGQPGRARDALAEAQRGYDRTGDAHCGDSVFGFSPRRRLFYQGRLLTMLSDYAGAWAAHRQALELYPDEVVGDTTLIYLDRAAALVGMNHPDEAAELVVATLLSLPPAHRGKIFIGEAAAVMGQVPASARRLPAIRACREVLVELLGQLPDAAHWALVPQLATG